MRLGEDCYSVLTNNCEHFCEWCVRGEHRSYQVDERSAGYQGMLLRLIELLAISGRTSAYAMPVRFPWATNSVLRFDPGSLPFSVSGSMGARFTVLPRGGSPRSVQYSVRLTGSRSKSIGSGRLSTAD